MGPSRPATLWALMLVIPTVLIVTVPGIIGQPWENQGRQIMGSVLVLLEMMALAFVLWLLEHGLKVNQAAAWAEALTWIGLAIASLLWAPFMAILTLVTGWTVVIGRHTKILLGPRLASAVWVVGAAVVAWIWSQYFVS